jgi:DNA polymerase-3 subunit alpha
VITLDGCSKVKAEEIWQTVMKFSDYGFNRAHATGYGLMGYRMAYLKAHHPVEFMAALLAAWTGDPKKELKYRAEAQDMKIRIGQVNINKSGIEWTPDGQIIRRGLASIAKVGKSTAAVIVAVRDSGGPFTDIEDLIDRCPARPVTGGKDWKKDRTLIGVMAALASAGALDCLGYDRNS